MCRSRVRTSAAAVNVHRVPVGVLHEVTVAHFILHLVYQASPEDEISRFHRLVILSGKIGAFPVDFVVVGAIQFANGAAGVRACILFVWW